MLSSSLFWIFLAVAVFWAVGAYNRLVRLRSAVIQAFGGLDVHLVRMMALPGECAGASAPLAQAPAWQSLHAAAAQFGASLAVARAQPLQADAAAALSTALQVLCAAWEALGPLAADDAAPPGAPWAQQWEQLQLQRLPAQDQFNRAVLQYNEALAQFPAQLLAGIFGFQPGRTI